MEVEAKTRGGGDDDDRGSVLANTSTIKSV